MNRPYDFRSPELALALALALTLAACGEGSQATAKPGGSGSGGSGSGGSGSGGSGTLSTPETCPGASIEDPITPTTTRAPICDVSQYDKIENLPYASGAAHVLDLYLPKTGARPLPTVIWIHGGGWQSGSKGDDHQADRLVCGGYALASIDYRLSGEAPFPAQIVDVKAALRYLRAQASVHGLDPERFIAFGSSAGGHLAALAGVSASVGTWDDPSLGNVSEPSAVQAVVDWYGPTELSLMDSELSEDGCDGEVLHGDADSAESKLVGCAVGEPSCKDAVTAASPLTYVSASAPPFLVMHGTADCTVPPQQSAALNQALLASGACSSLHLVTGAEHGGPEWVSSPTQDPVLAFLNEVFGM